jgi:ABC-type transporter MlaC component
MTSAISNYFNNPYYGINQAGGVKPTDHAKSQEDAAKQGASGLGAAPPELAKDAREQFLDYAKLSVPERIRKQFLESKGLDEKSLASLSEEDRKAIEDEFRELLERKFKDEINKKGEQTGLVANILV